MQRIILGDFMMATINTQPVSSANYAYSLDICNGNPKRLNTNRPSWNEFRNHILKENMTYSQFKELYPNISENVYKRMLREHNFSSDHVRKHMQMNNEIAKMHKAGIPIAEIAKKFNMTEANIKNRLNNQGVSYDKFSTLLNKKDKIQELANQNYTKKAMAECFGVSSNLMSEALSCLNIQTQKEKLAEMADSLTKSKFLALLQKYGNLQKISENTGLSINKLKSCAKILNIIV